MACRATVARGSTTGCCWPCGEVDGPAVVTLVPGEPGRDPTGPEARRASSSRAGLPNRRPAAAGGTRPPDPEVVAIIEPDPATMDLADATRVMAGGAGLVAGSRRSSAQPRSSICWWQVAAALGASAGRHPGGHRCRMDRLRAADRDDRGDRRPRTSTSPSGCRGPRSTSAGWDAPAHRECQHRPVIPMTAMADLGLVTDARDLLIELAERFGVDLPDDLSARPRRHPLGVRRWSRDASRRRRSGGTRRRPRSTPSWWEPARPDRQRPWPWPGPAGRWSWSSGVPSPVRRTSTEGWSTGGYSTP